MRMRTERSPWPVRAPPCEEELHRAGPCCDMCAAGNKRSWSEQCLGSECGQCLACTTALCIRGGAIHFGMHPCNASPGGVRSMLVANHQETECMMSVFLVGCTRVNDILCS